MSYYKTCPNCGANLDPCEVCVCRAKEAPPPGFAALAAARVERLKRAVSTSYDIKEAGDFQS